MGKWGLGCISGGRKLITVGGKQVLESRHIVETVMGRKLKTHEVVHHINGDSLDNRNENLLVCTDAYHRLIHHREKARDACGNPNFVRCIYCKQWDDPSSMYRNGAAQTQYHRECRRKVRREKYKPLSDRFRPVYDRESPA